ncbi:MAG: hydroxysqualene dehydroxylase HpnE, partial [Betaproteobacteria bacterium]|nr:hydroxysqualene dehydroxylase HpnE [Betaproteobacteria bacterium]
MKLAVIGAGWAGCAAAVEAASAGAQVSLFEAARTAGGRARRVDVGAQALDNGQHILVGAYSESLRLMRKLGVEPTTALLRTQLTLAFPDGVALRLPHWPAPLHVVMGMLGARGLSGAEKRAFLAASLAWRRTGWRAAPEATVAQLAAALPARVRARFIDLLCVSALNTLAAEASAQVLLNVLRDSLGAGRVASDFLLPRLNLSALLPEPALAWLSAHGHRVHLGERVQSLERTGAAWTVTTQQGNYVFDAVILATPLGESARLVPALHAMAQAVRYEPITTVYVHVPGVRMPGPILALLETPTQPAQFVVDRGWLGDAPGTLALVVSASSACIGWADAQWHAAATEALA